MTVGNRFACRKRNSRPLLQTREPSSKTDIEATRKLSLRQTNKEAVGDFDGAAQGALGGYSLLSAAADALGSVTAQLQGSKCGKATVTFFGDPSPPLHAPSATFLLRDFPPL